MGLRTTLTLFLLLALTAVAIFVLGPKAPPEERTVPAPWPKGFSIPDVTSLLLYNQARGLDLELRFEREAPGYPWMMTFPRRDEADAAQLQQILGAIQHNRWQLVGQAAEIEAARLEQMGLVDPAGKPAGRGYLEIGQGGQKVEAYIGGPDVDDSILFVRFEDKVWRTQANLWSAFDHNLDDFRSRLLFSLGPHPRRVRIARGFDSAGVPAELLEFQRGAHGRWMLKEGELESRADDLAVDRFVAALFAARVRHFAGDFPADPQSAGLEPPFFRITVEDGQSRETVSIGPADGASVLAWREGRPYLLVMEIGDISRFLQGRGVLFYGDGVDFRGLRPLSFPLHTPKRLEIRREKKTWLIMERDSRGDGWNLVHPWNVALRDGSAQALFKALSDLRALSAYAAEDRPFEQTGLDDSTWTWELSVDGSLRPLVLHAGKASGRGVYMAVPSQELVFFVPGEALRALCPDPLELVSRLVLRLLPHQFQILRVVAGEKSLRLDRDMKRGLFRSSDGSLAGEFWEELIEGLADLSALRVVSAQAALMEREQDAITVLFHRNPLDTTQREPGELVETLRLIQGADGDLLVWKPRAPFVYQAPSRLWELMKRLLDGTD